MLNDILSRISQMKSKMVLGILFAAVFTFSMIFAQSAIASTDSPDMDITSSDQETAGSTLELTIAGRGDVPADAAEVPPWIKTSMQFWVDGQTSDAEFLNAVEFLANEKIIRVAEPTSTVGDVESPEGSTSRTGSWDTEMVSMNAARTDSFFDIFYESYSVDSFFDIFTELQSSSDSFFDVFFDVDTPRVSDCPSGEELAFDERTSSWMCSSENRVDSFFDVFFDISTDTAQNSEDIDELERKIVVLEKKIEDLENRDTDTRAPT